MIDTWGRQHLIQVYDGVTKSIQQCRYDGFIQSEHDKCIYSVEPLKALYNCSSTNSTSVRSILPTEQLRAKTIYSLTFPPPSIAIRHTFLQLS